MGSPPGAPIPLGSTVAFLTDRITRPVEGMHRTISRRWFDAVGPVAAPVRVAHDTISDAVYGGIRLAGLAVGAGLDLTVRVDPRTADGLTAFMGGVFGDDLGRHADAFATPTEVRHVGTPPTDRLVVLIHGLTETERVFDGDDGLLAALGAHPDLTPVAIRYHTGLAITENGTRVANLLDDLTTEWPVPVASVTLVGRSMGGLVARAACRAGAEAGHPWVGAVANVVTLATPHHGSWVARLAAGAARGMRIAPDTRPLADVIDGRSAGIRDLDAGMADELPPGIDHHFVAAVVTADDRNPLGRLVGDALVHQTSATGRHLSPTSAMTVTGTTHTAVHRHPDVVEAVIGWATETPAGEAG